MSNTRFISCVSAALVGVAFASPAWPEPALWQHHQADIQYIAAGTSYSCNGIEDKVRQILLYAGARQDLRVHASGCVQGPFLPSHMASVRVDFYALAPAADAPTAEVIPAQWVPLSMTPTRAQFLQPSDCDLVRAMKRVLTQSFSWQGLEFATSCLPDAGSVNSFAVKGAVLQPAARQSG
ncbi:MAG TPA: hypothetical protein VGH84_07910 [Steroidobacteraceae bacterium]|jgi:hypothetical protein